MVCRRDLGPGPLLQRKSARDRTVKMTGNYGESDPLAVEAFKPSRPHAESVSSRVLSTTQRLVLKRIERLRYTRTYIRSVSQAPWFPYGLAALEHTHAHASHAIPG